MKTKFKLILKSSLFFGLLLVTSSCGDGLCSVNGCGASGEAIISGASSTVNADGSVTVTITGAGFMAGDSINVDGTPCTHVTIVSSTQLTCILPSKNIPLTPIVVTHSGGTAVVKLTTAGINAFTVPAGVTSLQIELWGGGGGGGESDTVVLAGGGGGGGGYLKVSSVSVTPGQSISYSVGAGGAGNGGPVTNGAGWPDGAAGGDTSITDLNLTAHGGGGGLSRNGFAPSGSGGAGGTATGGDINTTGTSGQDANDGSVMGTRGANGGACANGGAGGQGPSGTMQGNATLSKDGAAPGGGGGGSIISTPGDNGANGANGQITFTYRTP